MQYNQGPFAALLSKLPFWHMNYVTPGARSGWGASVQYEQVLLLPFFMIIVLMAYEL